MSQQKECFGENLICRKYNGDVEWQSHWKACDKHGAAQGEEQPGQAGKRANQHGSNEGPSRIWLDISASRREVSKMINPIFVAIMVLWVRESGQTMRDIKLKL